MARADDEIRLPDPCLVVLVGPSSAGKSTWAAGEFAPEQIVSSDHLRAVVGHGEDDLDATDDAFALLELIVRHRLGRGLSAVIDTLGLDPLRRASYRALAAAHGVECVAVSFDIAAAACRERNRGRVRPLPADVLTRQLADWRAADARLDDEGFAAVVRPAKVRPAPRASSDAAPRRDGEPDDDDRRGNARLRVGLHLSAFTWPGDQPALPDALRDVAMAAEAAGFDSLWVMDHVRQIPQVGRDWDPMLESYTALAWLAAVTSRVRLGSLVTPVTFRNVGLLAKSIATLDVLSGGRATCGLGLGWYEREHQAFGWPFPAVDDRYRLLEDALQALPLLWGPGAKPFTGRVLDLPETIGYPRPRQAHIPMLVGGGGERRTLRLAARYADAANVQGDVDVVRRKRAVLRAHCEAEGRGPDAVELTVLSPTLVADSRAALRDTIERVRPRRQTAKAYAAAVNAGTIEDQVERLRELESLGVAEVMVSLPDLGSLEPLEPVARFGRVIERLRDG